MLTYEVKIVNEILGLCFTNQHVGSSYNIPEEECNIDRITFDQWLRSLGVNDEDVERVNWATACFRLQYLSLFKCDSCLCIPPMMLYMGFGIIQEELPIFNTAKVSTLDCCC